MAGWAGRPQMMWVGQEPVGPLRPLSAFSYKLVVLVTVSRLWLGYRLLYFLGDQWSAAGPPLWAPVRSGGKVGKALGWPICHEIMPKRQSVTQWQRAGVLSASSPYLHLTRSPAMLRGPGQRWHTGPGMVHVARAMEGILMS